MIDHDFGCSIWLANLSVDYRTCWRMLLSLGFGWNHNLRRSYPLYTGGFRNSAWQCLQGLALDIKIAATIMLPASLTFTPASHNDFLQFLPKKTPCKNEAHMRQRNLPSLVRRPPKITSSSEICSLRPAPLPMALTLTLFFPSYSSATGRQRGL